MLNKIGEHVSGFMLAIITFDILALIIALFIMFDEEKYEEISIEVEDFIIEHIKIPEISGTQNIEELEVHTLINTEYLDMLAHIINAEAGSEWCTDELQLAVGSVVINRIHDKRFPDNMHDVIFQDGQYSTTWTGEYYNTPSERVYANAEKLLREGVTIPENIVWQANFEQGITYKKIQTVYFGY